MNDPNNIQNGHPRTRGARSSFREEASLGKYPIRFGSIPSFDGASIFYCVEGEGQPLVFCYGIACSSLHWTYQIDYFRQHYQCIWVDYRGHRHTPIPEDLDTLTVDACARDLKAVLDFLDVKEATFLGHSMGVNVVLEFAHLFPQMVQGLVLANGTAKQPLETLFGGNFLVPGFKLLSILEKNKPEIIEGLWKLQEKTKLIGQGLGRLGFNRSLADPEDILIYAKQMAELPPIVLSRMMDNYQLYDATPWLHEITQKTLIFSGEKDLITPPPTQDLIAQLMPNAELVRLRHGSHCSTLDLPDLINLLIEKFLKQIY
jgi:pimeloyl-ACP methyl ester carboxylesterase